MEKTLYPSQHPSYNPDGSLLRKHQMRILGILCEVDKICRRHDLKYWLCSGTLLGAVRHGGFIPWDDDIDIEMPMSDYRRALEILPTELPENLVLQTHDTDSNYYLMFAKVRDLHSCLTEKEDYDRHFKHRGVFVDIFPVERTNRFCQWLSRKSHGLCYHIVRNTKNTQQTYLHKINRVFKFETKFFFPLLRGLSKIMPSSTYCALGIPFSNERKDKYVYPLRKIDFEGHSFPAPGNTDAYLKAEYGDYMKIPTNITPSSHGFVRID
ncbi:MAG: LicD family protein [Bacteroides sp.]|nr:LicD family protein [Bacteroides sp.]